MSLRLLSVAAAAAAFAFMAPSPDVRAAASTMPIAAAKGDASSIVTDVRDRRHYRGHRAYRGSRNAYRHSYRNRGYRHSRGWRGPRVAIYAGPAWYGYRRSYRGCGWLRARAINSGSRYWWRRYKACRRGW